MTLAPEAKAAGLALVAGLAIGGAVGFGVSPPPPPPRVEIRVRELTEEEKAKFVRVVTVEGPERVVQGPTHTVERWRAVQPPAPSSTPAGCPPPPACEEHEREFWTGGETRERGPSTTASSEGSSSASKSESTSESKREPVLPKSPRFAVAWHPTILPTLGLGQLGASLRIVGPIWAEAWVAPMDPSAGAGLRVEF
jgi:hypothetical protein